MKGWQSVFCSVSPAKGDVVHDTESGETRFTVTGNDYLSPARVHPDLSAAWRGRVVALRVRRLQQRRELAAGGFSGSGGAVSTRVPAKVCGDEATGAVWAYLFSKE